MLAHILPDGEAVTPRRLLNRKYGLLKRIFDAFRSLRHVQQAFIEIVPS